MAALTQPWRSRAEEEEEQERREGRQLHSSNSDGCVSELTAKASTRDAHQIPEGTYLPDFGEINFRAMGPDGDVETLFDLQFKLIHQYTGMEFLKDKFAKKDDLALQNKWVTAKRMVEEKFANSYVDCAQKADVKLDETEEE